MEDRCANFECISPQGLAKAFKHGVVFRLSERKPSAFLIYNLYCIPVKFTTGQLREGKIWPIQRI